MLQVTNYKLKTVIYSSTILNIVSSIFQLNSYSSIKTVCLDQHCRKRTFKRSYIKFLASISCSQNVSDVHFKWLSTFFD